MKICFVQKQAFPYFGIMALSGFLKQSGIETDVLISNLEKDLSSRINEVKPDLIGISLMSSEHEWLRETSRRLKETAPGVPIMVGGVHAILYPDKILEIPSVDYVCTGEGESTLVGFCEVLRQKRFRDLETMAGIGWRRGGIPVINERACLWEDLDAYFDDRDIYYNRYPSMREDELKQFTASRGCPFRCAFCFNEHISGLFKSKGKYVRLKTPEHFIEEIRSAKAGSSVKVIFFADDLFTANRSWLKDFIPRYRAEIGLPFMCTTRANLMDEEIAGLLKEGGCHTVTFGLETGNEKIRSEVLGKTVTDGDILKCSEVLKKNGIRIQTSNMFCLPGETLEDAFRTVEMNIKIKSDFVYSTIFMPFPGTRLAGYCIDRGYLRPDFALSDLPQSFLTTSVLKINDKEKIENVQKIMHWLVRFPFLLPAAKWAILNFRFKKPYEFLLLLGTFFRYKEERKISFFNALKFLWRLRKSYR